MANSQTNNMDPQVQSAMPPPVMEYVNKYTDEAVKNGFAPKPPPPIKDTYQMFGQTCHQDDAIIRPLEVQGLKRLHPEVYDKKEELQKITVSILCNFLDLLDILVKCGVSPGRDEKIEDLNILFIHMHHLINEFRPHQAREALKVMMEMQKKNMIEANDRLSKNKEKASEILKQCSEELADLIVKHKSAPGDKSDQPESMDVDDILSSALSSISHPPDGDASLNSKARSSQESKDLLMCELLENINE